MTLTINKELFSKISPTFGQFPKISLTAAKFSDVFRFSTQATTDNPVSGGDKAGSFTGHVPICPSYDQTKRIKH